MTVFYHVSLTPEQEVLDVTSTASGSGWVIYDSNAVAATYSFDIDGFDFTYALSGPPPKVPTPPIPVDSATRTHFHAQARDMNGGIVFGQLDPYDDMDDLAVVHNADNSWSVSGRWETTDVNANTLASKSITNLFPALPGVPAGATFASVLGSATPGSEVPLYFNVHSDAFAGGEIRGQLVAVANDIDDVHTGTTGNDVLDGRNGNDAVLGLAGDDTLLGGNDNDVLDGGAGNDTLSGGNGNDMMYGSTGDDVLDGRSGDDTMEGGSGDDDLLGGNGNDTMDGNNGNDDLNGGNDNDTMNGGAGEDVLIGGSDNDTMDGGADNDTLTGGTGNDSMNGGAGDDGLNGGNGNDTLNGGTGDDTLTGKSGVDLFVFHVDFGDDVITDFGSNDFIQFDDELFATPLAALQAAQQVGDDTVITAGTNTVTLLGVDLSSLQTSDFLIVA